MVTKSLATELGHLDLNQKPCSFNYQAILPEKLLLNFAYVQIISNLVNSTCRDFQISKSLWCSFWPHILISIGISLKCTSENNFLDISWFRKGLVIWNLLLMCYLQYSLWKWHFPLFLTFDQCFWRDHNKYQIFHKIKNHRLNYFSWQILCRQWLQSVSQSVRTSQKFTLLLQSRQ